MSTDRPESGGASRGAEASAASIPGLPAGELARRIARGELSSEEAVEAHIRRLDATDAELRAVCVRRFDAARDEARAADEARRRGRRLGLLHGVPVTVKELFDVRGTPTTGGLTARAGHRADADAAAVARLRAAGAVVLGKTNVPQFGLFYESDNPLYGATRSPWSPERSPGGSSGGEAAVISAGGSPLGLASDGGGSIRQPAHATGICGLKPTTGRLPMDGHFEMPTWIAGWIQPGPMARTVGDLALGLRALAAPAPDEPRGLEPPPVPWGDPAALDLRGLRIGFYVDDGFFPPSPAPRRAVREAVRHLEAEGAHVEEFHPPDVERAYAAYFGLFLADGLRGLRRLLRGSRPDWRIRRLVLGARMPGCLRRPGARLLETLGRDYEARMTRWVLRRVTSPGHCLELLQEAAAYRRSFLEAMERHGLDALLSPPYALPALRHGSFYGTFAGCYAFLYNLLGFPAGVVPVTHVRNDEESDRAPSRDPAVREALRVEEGSAGLPAGVQVAAPPWREDVVLRVLGAIEERVRSPGPAPRSPPAG